MRQTDDLNCLVIIQIGKSVLNLVKLYDVVYSDNASTYAK